MSTTSSAAAARGSWCRGPFQEPWSVRPLAGPQAGRQMDSLALGHRQRDAKRPAEGRQASAGLRLQDPARVAVGATQRTQRALAERVELVRQSTPLLRSFQPPRLSLMLLLALLSVTAAAVALPQAHRATRDVLSRPSALAENFVVFGDSCVRTQSLDCCWSDTAMADTRTTATLGASATIRAHAWPNIRSQLALLRRSDAQVVGRLGQVSFPTDSLFYVTDLLPSVRVPRQSHEPECSQLRTLCRDLQQQALSTHHTRLQ